MGKPVLQAVEAISDAITGENERLKEFGIKGSKDKELLCLPQFNVLSELCRSS